MKRLSQVRTYARARRGDARGWLLKVMAGNEEGVAPGIGEVYVTCSLPGEARGHHFHPLTREWFTVLQGAATLVLEDPETHDRRQFSLTAASPLTVEIPPGIAHVIIAEGDRPMLLAAAASRPYDPADVTPFRVGLEVELERSGSDDD